MIAVRFARRTLRELDRIEAWYRANLPARWPVFTADYRYHPEKGLIVVLSIWSTRRRRPPSLR